MQITQNTPLIKMNPNKLFYYKCLDCLSPVSTDIQSTDGLICDCGGDHLTFMGQVMGSNYGIVTEQCKCNEICVHAAGPCCSCQCLGRNHGLGKLAYTQVNKITGKVERRIPCKEQSKDHAIWYRSIVKQCEDDSIYGDFQEALENRKKGINVPYTTYMVLYKMSALKMEFRNAKTVKKRQTVHAKIKALTTKAPALEVANGT